LSCDFVGRPRFGKSYRFILETKFLKENAQNRARHIIADLVRLSMPGEKNLKRYLLVAGHSKYFPKTNANFIFGRDLFNLSPNEGRYIRPREEVRKPDFAKLYPQYQLLSNETLSDYTYVQFAANEKIPITDKDSFQVVIWSVGRSERAAREGISEA